MKTFIEVAKQIVGVLMDNETKVKEIMEIANDILNNWELNFMESISRLDLNSLSEARQYKLDQIYEKACASGL